MAEIRERNPPIESVHVCHSDNGDEFYRVGFSGVTAIEWHEQPGHMAMIPTIRVFREGRLHSEHPFHNVLSVYYDPDFAEVTS